MSEKKFSLKSLFVADETEKPVAPEPTKTETVISIKKESPSLESKTKKVLLEVLEEEGNKKNIGYTQYKRSLFDLKDIISDEKTRFISAFIASRSIGLTKDTLILTGEESKKILEKEKIRFESTVNQDFQQNVDDLKNKISGLQGNITQKTAELQKLTEEIAEFQKQQKELENTLSLEQTKIEKLKEDFICSYSEIDSEIDSDLSKIKLYLQ